MEALCSFHFFRLRFSYGSRQRAGLLRIFFESQCRISYERRRIDIRSPFEAGFARQLIEPVDMAAIATLSLEAVAVTRPLER